MRSAFERGTQWVVCISCLCVFAAGVTPVMAATGTNGFERYQLILDRSPFGSSAVPVESESPVPDPEPPEATHLRLTSIYEFGSATRVGLVDQQTNRSYVVREGASGEENEGFTLIRTNISTGEAVLQKDARQFALHISDAPVISASAREQAAAAQRQAAIPRRPPWARRMRSTNDGDADSAARQRPTREEMEARLRTYREEVERQGLPPLPAPLTTD